MFLFFSNHRLFVTLILTVLLLLNFTIAQSRNISESLARNGCLNVVIVNDFAYAACGQEIEVVALTTFERRLISVAADDISADVNAGLLFTQSGRNLTMLSLEDPFQPSVVTTATTNFSFFSGVSALSGVLAVSGGARGANTQIYTYTPTSLTLRSASIEAVDSATGNPDVLLAQTSMGLVAYYSQDIGSVANFAIRAVSLSNQGEITSDTEAVVLTAGRFNFSLDLGPTNFPVESEFLDGRLYVAHFAAQGLEVINTQANDGKQLEQVIALPFVPTNVATDGTLLFVVGSTNNSVAVVNPVTRAVIFNNDQTLSRPTGIAASTSHIVVADRDNGLIVINRTVIPNQVLPVMTPVILFLLEGA